VEVIDRFGPQLHEPMSMPEFLQNGATFRIGPIDPREFVLEQQIKNQFRITSIGLLSGTRPPANLGGVADSGFNLEFKEQILKPLAVTASFQPDNHSVGKRGVKLSNLFRLRVIKFEELNFTVVCIAPSDGLLPSVKINTTIHWHGDSFHFSSLLDIGVNYDQRA